MLMAESESIAALIITVRGQMVLLDSDLAALYGVTTKRFKEQVKRNRDRFPEDFMFRLAQKEFDALRSQNATSNDKARGVVAISHGSLPSMRR